MSRVLTDAWDGARGIRKRLSRFGFCLGISIADGPRKMVFSTFAAAKERRVATKKDNGKSLLR